MNESNKAKILVFDVAVRQYPKDKNYLVSTNGDIYSTHRGNLRKLNPWLNRGGYRVVKVRERNCLVHRLVAETFIPNESGLETVDHIDFNKSNNHMSNLRWMTRADNASLAGRGTYSIKDLNGNIHTFTGQAEFARNNGLTQANLSKVLLGERPHHLGWTLP